MENSEYETKKEARIERLRALADKAEAEAETLSNQARRMADVIPLGQPIMVGHYSETRDRNYRAKISRKYDAAHTAYDKAGYYRQRAEAAENNRAISSDDPDAIAKLDERRQAFQEWLDTMKSINAAIRRAKLTTDMPDLETRLADLGFDNSTVAALMHLVNLRLYRKVGFPGYAITNLSANIRRVVERMKQLETKKAQITKEVEINGVRLVDSVEDNRVQLFFPNKPPESVREYLSQNGFHWTPSFGCWQRFRSTNAWFFAQEAAKML